MSVTKYQQALQYARRAWSNDLEQHHDPAKRLCRLHGITYAQANQIICRVIAESRQGQLPYSPTVAEQTRHGDAIVIGHLDSVDQALQTMTPEAFHMQDDLHWAPEALHPN